MDFFAVTSTGAYPSPSGSPSAAERAAYAVTRGLLSSLPAPPTSSGGSMFLDLSLLI